MVDNGGKSDIIKMEANRLRISMQFFGTPNFKNQRTAGLKKTIKSLQERIDEHNQKIAAPQKIYGDEWETFSENRKKGAIRHWAKEIEDFQNQLEQAKEELLSRGENYEQ